LRLTARAKINLYLHVLGRRADGYHLLDSLIAFAEFGDEVLIEAAPGFELFTAGPLAATLRRSLAAPAENLVLRAARALAASAGTDKGAKLTLEKRLPPAAGLGGGSSDAAVTLLGLARLWQLRLTSAELAAIGLGLGADLPACLGQPAPVFVGGIGEALAPAPDLPQAGLLLANPGLPLPTAEVFRGLRGAGASPARFRQAPRDAAALAALLAERRNDLEAPARRLAPEIDRVLGDLRALPGLLLARMSGSGATCFGLFADLETARRGAAVLAEARPHWWLQATRLAAADS